MRIIILMLFSIPYLSFSQLTPCQQEIADASGLIGEFIPQCEEDGSYSSTQCWLSTGYCWCVDEDGIEIPGTSIASWLGTPSCSESIESCLLIPDPGPCQGQIEAFYFDQIMQECSNFIWGGCNGLVPFTNLEDCEDSECANNSFLCEANFIEGCTFFAVWDPVCGCNGETYSNSADAACNSIYEYNMGECKTDWILGCTDSIACNFNHMANENDESCVYPEANYDCYHNCLEDQDDDFICDPYDNCINVYNPDQMDENNDGIGDICEEYLIIYENTIVKKKLIKVIDLVGRDIKIYEKRGLVFYLFNDGSVEKKFFQKIKN